MAVYKLWTYFMIFLVIQYVQSMAAPNNHATILPLIIPGNNLMNTGEGEHVDPTEQTILRYKRQDTTTTAATTSDATNATTAAPATDTTAATVPPAASFVPNPGTPGFACPLDLYQRINQRCCLLPALVEKDVIEKCNKAANFGNLPMKIASHSGGKNIPLRKIVVKSSRRTGPVKNSTISLSVSQICLTQCVFKQLRWLNKDNQIDESFMYQFLSIQLPVPWSDKITNARADCISLLTSDPQAYVVNTFGTKCNLLPTKLLRCLKRYMMYECAIPIQQDKQCQFDMMKLKACDINLL